MKVCMIAGNNADYIFSLVQALSRLGLSLELLGGNDYEHLEYDPCVTFVKVRASQDSSASLWAKAIRIVSYYYRCVTYLRKSDVDIVHIQAFHFKFFEGVILVYLFKQFGKRVVYTAHNVQTKGKNDTLTHIIHLLIYRNVHHIICHTMDIKNKLLSRYGITSEKISVIQRGINSLVPITTLSQCEARRRLNIDPRSRVLLLFGRIRPVKGYEIVLQALGDLLPSIQPVTLLIAGNAVNQTNQNYLEELRRYVKEKNLENVVQFHAYHIPEDHIELFFKATDVVLLPYVESDFQSGVLFLALRFGVPVIASDISLLPEAIAQGVWGYVFDVGNPRDLAAKIVQFYRDLQPRCGLCQSIQEYGRKQYSWEATAMATVDAYHRVLKHRSGRPSL